MGGITEPVPGTSGPHDALPRRRLLAIGALLFLASAINYMDRQTLANVGKRVTDEFSLTEQQYGALETGFGLSFAAGSLGFGVLADRVSIRWLYPIILGIWSLVGLVTGYSETYDQLLICRCFLGFFEGGHWPCGLKTTQALLSPGNRAMGNSVLQSGTSVGAIITPLIMFSMLTSDVGSWRSGFILVGFIGLFWIVAWFLIVRGSDLRATLTSPHASVHERPWWRDILSRKMLIVLVIIILINTTWQTLRAWLPKIMQQEHGYSEGFTSVFTSFWYAGTDIGCLASGAIALALKRHGWSVFTSRLVSFSGCALFCSLLLLIPFVKTGPGLLAIFLLAGAGTLGLFPIYYSLSQDISPSHQGKVAGITGVIAWSFSSPAAMLFGWLADSTRSFNTGIAIAGGLPLLALLAVILFWPRDEFESPSLRA
jgi:ACS family hexuronate transporter-like MFS transporter